MHVNRNGGTPVHCAAFDYSSTDWDGFGGHIKDVPQVNIFDLVLLLMLLNIASGVLLEMMCIIFIKNERCSLIPYSSFSTAGTIL